MSGVMNACNLAARCAVALGLTGMASAVPGVVAAERDWTSETSVAVRYLVESQDDTSAINPPLSPNAPLDGSGAIVWSPGNRYFFFITRAGDLRCDCLRYALTVYDGTKLASVLGNSAQRERWVPTPLNEVSFESVSSMAGVSAARWLNADNIVFFGMRNGFRQVYRLSARDGALTQLTDVAAEPGSPTPEDDDTTGSLKGPSGFDIRGDTLMYTTTQRVSLPPLIDRYPAVSISELRLSSLDYYGAYLGNIYLSHPVGSPGKLVARCNQRGQLNYLSMSADGRWIVTTCGYTENLPVTIPERDRNGILQYLLIDSRNGHVRPIANAPSRLTPAAVWSDDNEHVALLNAFLGDGSKCSSASQLHVVTHSVTDDTARCVLPMAAAEPVGNLKEFRVRGVEWRDESHELIVSGRQASTRDPVNIGFRERDGLWARTEIRPTPQSDAKVAKAIRRPVNVEVRRSANEAWSIVARSGTHAIPLSNPDPVLEGVQITRMIPIEWKEAGTQETGGLYLPSHMEKGARVPLVIQAGNYVPERFLPDGSASTAYAAQSLVAQGMAVLNIDIASPRRPPDITMKDEFGERIEQVVAKLDQEGIVDRQRVGIVGFSQGGYQVHYLATHPRTVRLTAAVVADSWTGGYGQYTYFDTAMRDSAYSQGQMVSLFGGTFWENKAEWLRESPMFNVERVTAAVLFTLNTKRQGALAGEAIAAYRINRKPFEYLLFPGGGHQLVRPLERKASMDATVAWMAFWLQDREISGLQTPETYERWHRMKDLAAKQIKANHASSDQPNASVETP